ncbi:MAG TPA: J domain-containing protein [Acidimicrobiales bacterium]|nr:J domain-containing protein [Acidimicrobiales bacterium]
MTDDLSNGDRMYRRLQVPPEASAQQIRRSYRRLAHEIHPDTHPDDPEASRRFREITEAYDILGSPERRATYDRARRSSAPPTRPVQAGSAPLIAGPVRITRPGGNADDPPAAAGLDLIRFIQAIWSRWERW